MNQRVSIFIALGIGGGLGFMAGQRSSALAPVVDAAQNRPLPPTNTSTELQSERPIVTKRPRDCIAPPPSSVPARRRKIYAGIDEPDEADLLVEEALTDVDVTLMVNVVADLIQMGEPGFLKLDELFTQMVVDYQRDDGAISGMWQKDAVMMHALPVALENPGAVLDYAYHVQELPEGQYEDLKGMSVELMRGGGAGVLASLSGDPLHTEKLVNFYTDKGKTRPLRRIELRALADIRTPASSALLLQLLDKEPSSHIVYALAMHGDDSVVPKLEAISAIEGTPLAKAIATAVAYLQR